MQTFLLIIAHDDAFIPSPRLIGEIGAWVQQAVSTGARIDGAPLKPPAEARTLRIRDGWTNVSSGPFKPGGEQIAAIELITCKDMNAALELAAAHPMAREATIEIRPVWTALAAATPTPNTS